MRKFAIFSVMLAALLFCSSCRRESSETLYVFNWGDYIDPEVLRMFQEEQNVRIVYQEYATNEDLYVKMKNTKEPIDVIFPSDYMLERMIREHLVRPLDRSKLSNFDKIDPHLLHAQFDPENAYSVPYFWGTVGIVYNRREIPEGIRRWADLWDEKYARDIVLYNSQRDVLMMALKKLGYSMNTRSVEELEEAKRELIRQKPLIYAYLGDEIKDVLASGDADIGLVYSGDAGTIMRLNDDFEYVLPEEGTNLWIDACAIAHTSRHPELAHRFIDFLMRPDIAAMNAQYLCYATPIDEAKAFISEDLLESDALYPDFDQLHHTEFFRDPSDMLKTYDRIWTEVLSGIDED